VSSLNGFVNFGLDLPTKPVLTGPGIVSKANVDATLAGVAAGARVTRHRAALRREKPIRVSAAAPTAPVFRP
jgi:hypothetical protein